MIKISSIMLASIFKYSGYTQDLVNAISYPYLPPSDLTLKSSHLKKLIELRYGYVVPSRVKLVSKPPLFIEPPIVWCWG